MCDALRPNSAYLKFLRNFGLSRYDVAGPRRDGEPAVSCAQIDRLGITNRERFPEQPLRDRVRQRVFVARVPQPHGHAGALRVGMRECEAAKLETTGCNRGVVRRA